MLTKLLPKLLNHENLTQAEAEAVMNQIMAGEASPAQIGAYLVALRMRSATR